MIYAAAMLSPSISHSHSYSRI